MIIFFQEASLYFIAVVLEAFGFMLIGCLVGGVIEEFVPDDAIPRLIGKRQLTGILLAGLAGIVFPVCECAIVPVMSRLIKKGTPPAVAITFMLAVPIVNPVVIFSTFTAFSFSYQAAFLRFISGYIVAVFIGLLISAVYRKRLDSMIIMKTEDESCCSHGDCHAHHHNHSHASSLSARLKRIIEHSWDDFTGIAGFLFLGAAVSAVFRAIVSMQFLEVFKTVPGGSNLFMMIVAFVLNLCSEADAFIANSFTSLFPASALLAFMVLGPMLDIKLLIMYRRVFKSRLIIFLGVIIFITVFVWIALLDSTGLIPEVFR